MQLKNQEIINILNVFEDIAEKDLPVELAFDLHALHSECMQVYQTYVTALQPQLKEAGVKSIEDLPDKTEVNRLLQKTVEIHKPKIKRAALIDSGLTFSLAQIYALAPILEDSDG